MQQCSICEKKIFGHPKPSGRTRRVSGVTVADDGPVVCGSCPLSKSQGGPSGKSFFEVRIDMAKLVTKPIPKKQEIVMSDLKVKSNVRNRTILLDGRFPVVFDEEGLGKVAIHHRELLEREMAMRPGRFSYVQEETPVAEVAPEPVVIPVEPEKTEEPVKAEVTEVPPSVDLSFLTEEPVTKPSKASKKK